MSLDVAQNVVARSLLGRVARCCGEELVDGVLEGVESQLQTRRESGAVRQLTTQREVLILKLLKHKVKVS